jgi:hypothetical protein
VIEVMPAELAETAPPAPGGGSRGFGRGWPGGLATGAMPAPAFAGSTGRAGEQDAAGHGAGSTPAGAREHAVGDRQVAAPAATGPAVRRDPEHGPAVGQQVADRSRVAQGDAGGRSPAAAAQQRLLRDPARGVGLLAVERGEPTLPTPPPPAVREPVAARPVHPDVLLRVEADREGSHFWLGGGVAVTSVWALVTHVRALVPADVSPEDAELALGISARSAAVTITPMAGLAADLRGGELSALVAPQLYTTARHGPLRFESWIRTRLGSVFDRHGDDRFYTRNALLLAVGKVVAVGPQFELDYRLNQSLDRRSRVRVRELREAPVGVRLDLGYGRRTTLGIFLGRDGTPASGPRVTGRLSLVHAF